MKALLKLTETMDDVRKLHALCEKRDVCISHKKHEFLLDEAVMAEGGMTINYGGYGSYARVGPGESFGTRWMMQGPGTDVPNQKQLTGVTVAFLGESWDRGLSNGSNFVKIRSVLRKLRPCRVGASRQ